MKTEIGKFSNGSLKLIGDFEPESNSWKKDLTWVPSEDEIELIVLTYLGIDQSNKILRKNIPIHQIKSYPHLEKRTQKT